MLADAWVESWHNKKHIMIQIHNENKLTLTRYVSYCLLTLLVHHFIPPCFRIHNYSFLFKFDLKSLSFLCMITEILNFSKSALTTLKNKIVNYYVAFLTLFILVKYLMLLLMALLLLLLLMMLLGLIGWDISELSNWASLINCWVIRN